MPKIHTQGQYDAHRGNDHDGQEAWPEYDARGIYLCKVCDQCEEFALKGFRREVLTDPGYECDEPIEPYDC